MRIEIDDPAFVAAGITLESRGKIYVCTVPNPAGGPPLMTVPVAFEDGALAFFPQRASAHRILLGYLGRAIP